MDNENLTDRRANEAALISAILRKTSLFADCCEIVSPADFDWIAYANVWQAAKTVQENGLTIDPVTVADQLARDGHLEDYANHYSAQFNGRAALSDLRAQPARGDVMSYAAIVKDYSARAEMLKLLSTGAMWCQNGRQAVDIVKDLTQMIEKVNVPGKVASRTVGLDQVAEEAMSETVRASEGERKIIPTGYGALDKLVKGFEAPDLTIVGALPGQGKTAFLVSVLKNIYDNMPYKRILFLTLEMSRTQIYRRLVSAEAGISYDTQMSGDLSADDWEAYNRVHSEMQTRKNIAINDVKAISPAAIAGEIRRFEPDIVFLDYLQLATPNARTERRHEQVSAVARELKNLAGQFSVPVVAAAQINRDTKRNDNARPQLQNLAESAGLEQAADNVFFLHRPDEMDMRTQVIVAKRRNGPVGEITLMYVPSKTRFQSMP